MSIKNWRSFCLQIMGRKPTQVLDICISNPALDRINKTGLGEDKGYYYYPTQSVVDSLRLVAISRLERSWFSTVIDGNYLLPLTNWLDETQSIDAFCTMDNNRIPTHKTVEALDYRPWKALHFSLRPLVT